MARMGLLCIVGKNTEYGFKRLGFEKHVSAHTSSVLTSNEVHNPLRLTFIICIMIFSQTRGYENFADLSKGTL